MTGPVLRCTLYGAGRMMSVWLPRTESTSSGPKSTCAALMSAGHGRNRAATTRATASSTPRVGSDGRTAGCWATFEASRSSASRSGSKMAVTAATTRHAAIPLTSTSARGSRTAATPLSVPGFGCSRSPIARKGIRTAEIIWRYASLVPAAAKPVRGSHSISTGWSSARIAATGTHSPAITSCSARVALGSAASVTRRALRHPSRVLGRTLARRVTSRIEARSTADVGAASAIEPGTRLAASSCSRRSALYTRRRLR